MRNRKQRNTTDVYNEKGTVSCYFSKNKLQNKLHTEATGLLRIKFTEKSYEE